MEDIPGFTTDEERDELAQLSAQLDWHYRADAGLARLRNRLRQDGRVPRSRVLPFVRRFAAVAALVLVTFLVTGTPDSKPEIIPGFLSMRQSREAMAPAVVKLTPRDQSSVTLTVPFAPLERTDAGRLTPGPRVDLQLEVRNDRVRPITLDVGGERTMLRLELNGQATRTLFGSTGSPPFLIPHLVTVKPGESFLLPIPYLIGGRPGRLAGVYATAPGRYTLRVMYRVGVKGEPRDLIVSSPPVTIEVKAP